MNPERSALTEGAHIRNVCVAGQIGASKVQCGRGTKSSTRKCKLELSTSEAVSSAALVSLRLQCGLETASIQTVAEFSLWLKI